MMKHFSTLQKILAGAVVLGLALTSIYAVYLVDAKHNAEAAANLAAKNAAARQAATEAIAAQVASSNLGKTQAHVSNFSAPVLQTTVPSSLEQVGLSHRQQLADVTMGAGEKAAYEMPVDFIPSNQHGQTDGAPFSRINLKEIVAGSQAISALGAHLSAVASWYGYTDQELKQKLLSDSSLHVDRKGRLLNIDAGLPASAALSTPTSTSTLASAQTGTLAGSVLNAGTASGATVTSAPPFPLTNTFKLHSKANSTRILYLKFTGEGSKPAFSLDNIPSTFNDAEQAMIQKIWQRVTEDYSPFDVDVTTEKPTNFAGKLGVTILITPEASSAGGYAYLNSFTNYTGGLAPAFCFPNNLANSEKPIAECISHELGHTLGLNHQGQLPSTAYYGGQGDGEAGWAPIMGVSYYKNLSQWSKGEYANANNKEDAFAVMAVRGLKPNVDDVGNTIATAMAMSASNANGFNNLSASGLISVPGDVDVFKFSAGAGTASFTLSGALNSQNLDIAAQLMDANGKVLAITLGQVSLNKTLSFNLPSASTYYLNITGAGRGSAASTGYSNYGSLGQYSIVGKTALSSGTTTTTPSTTPTTPPSTTPPTPTPSNFTPVTVTFDARSTIIAGATIRSYAWNFGDSTAAGSGALVTHTYNRAGTFVVVLTITDSLNRNYVANSTVTIH
ncbi:MAG: PKD domain-containing protein [Undibacterium sp.]|nr:PKD domain-containing protein [Undibacterium sp.]